MILTSGTKLPTRCVWLLSPAYVTEMQAFEIRQTADQIEDVADWLGHCDQSPLLAPAFPVYRLPLAIIQSGYR